MAENTGKPYSDNNSLPDGTEGQLFTHDVVRAAYQTLGLTGQGMVVAVIPVDKDGFLPLGQAVFMGSEEDLQDLGALTLGLYNKGYSLFLPDWFREMAGLPPLVNGCSPEARDAEGGDVPP